MNTIKAKLASLFKRDFTGTKPGIATSEFWIAGATSIIGVLAGNGWIPTDVAARYQGDVHIFGYIAAAVASGAYAISRGITKNGSPSPSDLFDSIASLAHLPADLPTELSTALNKLLASYSDDLTLGEGALNHAAVGAGASGGVLGLLHELQSKLDAGLADVHDHVDSLEAKLEPKTGAAQGAKHAADSAVPAEPVVPLAPPAGPGGFPVDAAAAPVPEEAPEQPAPPQL